MAGDEAMIESWPLPTTEEHDAPFWEGARRGVVLMEACNNCGQLRFPPRPMCPHCRSRQRHWREMSGHGRIWSFIVPHPPLLPAFNPMAPYNVIVVAIEEDPSIRLVGNLVNDESGSIDEVDPAAIQVGDAVRAVFARMTKDVTLIRWIRRS